MPDAEAQLDPSLCAEIARSCACFNFRKASRSVTQLFDQTLAPTGLRSTQLVMLLVVHLNGPVSMSRLAHELVMDPSTLTRNLRPLLAQAFLRIELGNGRGGKRVELTSAGRAALLAAVPYWKLAQDKLVRGLGQERWRAIVDDLGTIVAAARAEHD